MQDSRNVRKHRYDYDDDYYYYAAFNAPCVSHNDDESQAWALSILRPHRYALHKMWLILLQM